MKTASVPYAWIHLHPTSRLDAPFWLRVAETVKARGIPPTDLPRVREVILSTRVRTP